jgi:Holliday junction resolvasome RuvABC endonuclease subunit
MTTTLPLDIPAPTDTGPLLDDATPSRVVGLDLSITATGIAWCDGSTYTVNSREVGDRRLLGICQEVGIAVDGRSIDLVVIEDLPTHAKSAGITGMVHGAVRAYLLRLRVPYVLVTPASLKKYATGKGNCGKPEMAVAAFKRAGREFGDDNQCDAWWLRAMGLDYLGSPVASLPAAQRAALGAVKWPAVVR